MEWWCVWACGDSECVWAGWLDDWAAGCLAGGMGGDVGSVLCVLFVCVYMCAEVSMRSGEREEVVAWRWLSDAASLESSRDALVLL